MANCGPVQEGGHIQWIGVQVLAQKLEPRAPGPPRAQPAGVGAFEGRRPGWPGLSRLRNTPSRPLIQMSQAQKHVGAHRHIHVFPWKWS